MIIQHHDSVVTSSDLGLALHCQYDLGNKSVGINSYFHQQYGRNPKLNCHLTMLCQVTNELDLEVQGEISPALIEQGTVESPTVVMSVTARWGRNHLIRHQHRLRVQRDNSVTEIRMSRGSESLTLHIIAGEAVEWREPKLATLLSSTLPSSI